MAWPLMQNYREIVVVGDAAKAFNWNLIDIISIGAQGFFNRLLGFLNFAGLVADRNIVHDVSTISSYDSIGRYYTISYLGYVQPNHLSSPSLLGAFYIYSKELWLLYLAAFVSVLALIWRSASSFKALSIPVRCILAIEIFNVIMAGTYDQFFLHIVLIFICGVFWGGILRILPKVNFA